MISTSTRVASIRRFLTFFGIVLSVLYVAPARGEEARRARHNVLLIMADDLRPELASYGSPALTPALDQLAKRGLTFQRAYCQQALCNPSRSSMLTGLRPDSLGLWSNGTHFRELKPEVVTLPQWFKTQGYTTRCVGKIFHNWHTREKGDPRSWSSPEFLHYENHANDTPQGVDPLPPNLARAPKCECRDVPDEAYFDGRVAREAVRVLAEVKEQPFFLAVGFWKPHAPFNAPKKYWDLYDRKQLPPLHGSRPTGTADLAFHDGRELRGINPSVNFTAEEAAEIRHGYFANISYLDAQIGQVLAALRAHQLEQSTVVVFCGDHGYHLGEHQLWAKTSNFELDARVPLIVVDPAGRSAGKSTESLVELIDLFPTLNDLCGLPAPGPLDGISLRPLLENPKASIKSVAFTQHPRPAYYDRTPLKLPDAMGTSVRGQRFRYTEWRGWNSGELLARELYDHLHDPQETRNLIENPPDPAALEELVRQMPARSP